MDKSQTSAEAFDIWIKNYPLSDHSFDYERFTDFVVKQWRNKDPKYSTLESFSAEIKNHSNNNGVFTARDIREFWNRKERIEDILYDLKSLGYMEQ